MEGVDSDDSSVTEESDIPSTSDGTGCVIIRDEAPASVCFRAFGRNASSLGTGKSEWAEWKCLHRLSFRAKLRKNMPSVSLHMILHLSLTSLHIREPNIDMACLSCVNGGAAQGLKSLQTFSCTYYRHAGVLQCCTSSRVRSGYTTELRQSSLLGSFMYSQCRSLDKALATNKNRASKRPRRQQ